MANPYPLDQYTAWGKDLLWAFSIARATDPTHAVVVPVIPTSISLFDKDARSKNMNLASDSRESFLKVGAIEADMKWEALTRQQLDQIRSFAYHASDVYILALEIKFRVRAQDSIHYVDASNGFDYGNFIHSSAVLGSKRSVANGGPSLISQVEAHSLWSDAYADSYSGSNSNFFNSYDDANERGRINPGAGVPGVGSAFFWNYTASGFLARTSAPLKFDPITARSDLYNAQLKFEGV